MCRTHRITELRTELQMYRGKRSEDYVHISPPKSYHVDDHLSKRLFLFLVEVDENITVFVLKKLEGDGKMVVLQHALVIVHQGQLYIIGNGAQQGWSLDSSTM